MEANENKNKETAVEHNKFHSWSCASVRVVMGAIQCLTETKDMELSNVSFFSAIMPSSSSTAGTPVVTTMSE